MDEERTLKIIPIPTTSITVPVDLQRIGSMYNVWVGYEFLGRIYSLDDLYYPHPNIVVDMAWEWYPLEPRLTLDGALHVVLLWYYKKNNLPQNKS